MITTPKEKQEQFHKMLKRLLSDYDAEIALEDFGKGYSVDWKIVVDFKYDESFYEDHGTGEVPKLILGTYECGE